MRIVALYGTESGNAELVAEDLAAHLAASAEAEAADMSTFDVAELDPSTFYLVVCSTYGEGDLPAGAIPFAEALERDRPDLTGVEYAVFGLGDITYTDTYSRGSERIDELLASLGATRVGEYGRHDAGGFEIPSDVALAWVDEVMAGVREAQAA